MPARASDAEGRRRQGARAGEARPGRGHEPRQRRLSSHRPPPPCARRSARSCRRASWRRTRRRGRSDDRAIAGRRSRSRPRSPRPAPRAPTAPRSRRRAGRRPWRPGRSAEARRRAPRAAAPAGAPRRLRRPRRADPRERRRPAASPSRSRRTRARARRARVPLRPPPVRASSSRSPAHPRARARRARRRARRGSVRSPPARQSALSPWPTQRNSARSLNTRKGWWACRCRETPDASPLGPYVPSGLSVTAQHPAWPTWPDRERGHRVETHDMSRRTLLCFPDAVPGGARSRRAPGAMEERITRERSAVADHARSPGRLQRRRRLLARVEEHEQIGDAGHVEDAPRGSRWADDRERAILAPEERARP